MDNNVYYCENIEEVIVILAYRRNHNRQKFKTIICYKLARLILKILEYI